MKIYIGFIIENGEIIRKSRFIVNGCWVDNCASYIEIDDNGNEINADRNYFRKLAEINGKQCNLFF